jgi:hypothetical protein
MKSRTAENIDHRELAKGPLTFALPFQVSTDRWRNFRSNPAIHDDVEVKSLRPEKTVFLAFVSPKLSRHSSTFFHVGDSTL